MMKSAVFDVFKKSHLTFCKIQQLSTAAQPQIQQRLQAFRSNENNPMNHTFEHVGQFYRIPNHERQNIFVYGGIPRSYDLQTKTFNETCVMIRKPAMNIIHTLKAIDYSLPQVKFVIFGKKGTGRSLTLAHILHYAHKSGFLLVHVPWLNAWMRQSRKEISNSATREGLIDLNVDAAAWLVHFKAQNEHILRNPDLVLSEECVWSIRETTPKGAPLLKLIDHGINRIIYASTCVVILAEEIKKLSITGHVKTLVAVDGFNGFFYPKPRVFAERKEIVPPHKITLTQAFLSLTRSDWNNSASVLVVDEIAAGSEGQESYLPKYLLGKDGFEHLDPFVPVLVEGYTPKEFTSAMDYYRERKWVVPIPGQDEELAALSASNPYKLMQLCAPL